MKKLIESVKKNPPAAIVVVFVFALWGFMQLSAWQVFHNMYQCSASVAGSGWRIAGLILTAASMFWGHQMATDGNKITKDTTVNVIILGLLVALSLGAYMGFTTGYGCV